jgi:hypothetical protein
MSHLPFPEPASGQKRSTIEHSENMFENPVLLGRTGVPLIALLQKQPLDWSCLTSIVLFPLRDDAGYLAIRYEDFEEQRIDGDSFCFDLHEAKAYAKHAFNVDESDWQQLSREQALHVPCFVRGERVHPDDF